MFSITVGVTYLNAQVPAMPSALLGLGANAGEAEARPGAPAPPFHMDAALTGGRRVRLCVRQSRRQR